MKLFRILGTGDYVMIRMSFYTRVFGFNLGLTGFLLVIAYSPGGVFLIRE